MLHSTPKSPTAGGPLFKFTDPSLNQSANTVKQRLLQWCQMKTKEYEVEKIECGVFFDVLGGWVVFALLYFVRW